MSFKVYDLPNLGPVHIYRRRGAHHIRLSVSAEGKVRVSTPAWTPYRTALRLVQQRQDWLISQCQTRNPNLQPNQRIGKHHTLYFRAKLDLQKPRSRLTTNAIYIYHPLQQEPNQSIIQQLAHTAAQKALRQEAEQLLPQRLRQLSQQTNLIYTSVSIRQLKSRWGSCDSQQHITLNYYLMQLPWELIDYVLIHELAHTVHLHHGPDFWQTMADHLPNYKSLRKQLKQHQPTIISINQP